MGLRDRLGLRPAPALELPAVRALDLRPRPAGQAVLEARISRPVSFTGASATSRTPANLSHLTSEGFSGSSVVYRCAQGNAAAMAALDLVVDTVAADGTATPNALHPVSLLFNRRPNPSMSARMLKEVAWLQLELAGECFLYLDRGETGAAEPSGLWPIFDPVEVVVDRSTAGSLLGYRVIVEGGRKVPLLPAEVLWLRYPHPSQAWGAMSPLRAAAFAIDLDTYAKAWQLGELKNGARPEGVVYLGDVDPDVHDSAVADFEARHAGPANANRHLFVSGPTRADYTRIGLTAAELSYLDSRRVNAEDVALAFGWTMDELTGGATFENRRAAKVNRWTDVLLPKLEVVAGEVDRQLLPALEQTARFDVSQVDALQENQDAIYKRVQQMMYVDALLVDDARGLIGLDELPDGRGQLTLTAFRQAELDRLPGALTEAEQVERAAQLALSQGRDAAPRLARVRPQAPGRRARKARPLDAEAVQRQYDRLERVVHQATVRLAQKQARVVLGKAKRQGLLGRAASLEQTVLRHRASSSSDLWPTLEAEARSQVTDLFDPVYWQEFTREALAPAIGAVWDAGSSATAAALGLSFDQLDLTVLLAMDARLDVLSSQVTATTRQALEGALLLQGVAEGESVPDLAARLQQTFTDLEGWRAQTIARTETVGGFNASSRLAALESGVVARRTWMAASDHRVRDSHAELDGYTTSGLEDPYPNGLMHPGDPTGPAKETVNCRCVEEFELVED